MKKAILFGVAFALAFVLFAIYPFYTIAHPAERHPPEPEEPPTPSGPSGPYVPPPFESIYISDMIIVHIAPEYKEQFDNREFTAEDFKSTNIKELKYFYWITEVQPAYGTIFVYLIETGEKPMKEAQALFLSLDFVSAANILKHPPK